jgi:Family of unknown function (DUF6527)
MKARTLTPEFSEYIPSVLEPGTLYVSMQFETAVHLCACGCGSKVVTPFGPRDWTLTYDGTVTLRPSVGNGQQPCRSHYLIQHDRIDWLPQMSTAATRAAGVRDRTAHAETSTPPAPVTWWRRARNGISRLRNSD